MELSCLYARWKQPIDKRQFSIARTMSKPYMNLRGLDSKSRLDVEERRTNYARLASFMNADPDEIGK
jgi:hypothetical protein